MTDICEACGAEITVGAFPFCPHGRATSAVHQDSVEGGFWAENGFERPTYFDSKQEHRAALAARGMEIKAKWAGPNDKHLTRWDTVDLDGAKALLERGTQARREKADRAALAREFPITVTDIRYEEPSC